MGGRSRQRDLDLQYTGMQMNTIIYLGFAHLQCEGNCSKNGCFISVLSIPLKMRSGSEAFSLKVAPSQHDVTRV